MGIDKDLSEELVHQYSNTNKVVIGTVRISPILPTIVLMISVANISWLIILDKDESDIEKSSINLRNFLYNFYPDILANVKKVSMVI